MYRELWVVVRDEIRDLIISGELASGDRLIEDDLAARFHVSRGPVRTALMELERVGLVVSSPRKSSQVATFGPDDLDELYELIMGIESFGISRGVERLDDATLQELYGVQESLERAEAEGDRLGAVEHDLDFHRHLCGLASNRRLQAVWEQLSDQMRFVIASVQRVDPAVATKEGEHRHIIEALARGDGEAAVAALQEHLEIARARMSDVRQAVGSSETDESRMGGARVAPS
ncbi:MAG: GntR family transcriptional regulator [Acidimicrobiia bacterium]|nr:GntR family transcriptional regulator [Acidimicrobiia bacterium]